MVLFFIMSIVSMRIFGCIWLHEKVLCRNINRQIQNAAYMELFIGPQDTIKFRAFAFAGYTELIGCVCFLKTDCFIRHFVFQNFILFIEEGNTPITPLQLYNHSVCFHLYFTFYLGLHESICNYSTPEFSRQQDKM